MQTKTDIAAQIERCVRAADAHGVVWRAQLYCRNTMCDVREIEIMVKEHADDPPHARGPFLCPNCREEVVLHWVMDFEQWNAEEERNARISVNLQRRERKRDGELTAFSVAELLDDQLPE